MNRLEINAPGIAIEATSDGAVAPLGVVVVFHPSIARDMRQIVLEAALRHWKAEVGVVNRGGAPRALDRDSVWLPGWTIQPFRGEPTVIMHLAAREADEELHEQEQAHG